MPIQQSFSTFGLSRQAVKGTPTATATFNQGISSGGMFNVEITQAPVGQTTGTRDYYAVDRTAVKPAFSIDSRAMTKSVGMHLTAALGGYSVSGSGPYVHVATSSATNTLPYLTTYAQLDAKWFQIKDAMVDNFSLDFDQNGTTTMKCDGFGTALTQLTAPTVTNDDTGVTTSSTFLTALGGTLKLDTLTSTPVLLTLMGGGFSVKNNIQIVEDSTSVLPADVFPGVREITVTAKVQIADWTKYLAIVTNTTSGTTVSPTVPYGSVEYNFLEVNGGTATLKVASARVAWNTTTPTADVKGGPADITLTGQVLLPAGSNALTATLINTITVY